MEKKCNVCEKFKTTKAFSRNRNTSDRLNSCCKECCSAREKKRSKLRHKNWFLQRAFGISLYEYNEILVKQNYVCAICKLPESEKNRGNVKQLAVDHDHETNQVRGLLCGKCNKGIGNFKENHEFLLSALNYVKFYKKIPIT